MKELRQKKTKDCFFFFVSQVCATSLILPIRKWKAFDKKLRQFFFDLAQKMKELFRTTTTKWNTVLLLASVCLIFLATLLFYLQGRELFFHIYIGQCLLLKNTVLVFTFTENSLLEIGKVGRASRQSPTTEHEKKFALRFSLTRITQLLPSLAWLWRK